ncbi:hypothetical protein PoB_003833900 [Plakobranchus ocellatus]|uniref:REJ domain-containing protein n=1 Tax=Plakobranchus ocellatus TaxID=259542 RepID=A0AAV4B0D7_9GAST|nr:hypothetical protein PoB_003833900 [Plakobranchus ocellatus]
MSSSSSRIRNSSNSNTNSSSSSNSSDTSSNSSDTSSSSNNSRSSTSGCIISRHFKSNQSSRQCNDFSSVCADAKQFK